MVPRPFRVVERRRETHDTVTFAITSAGPVPTPAFVPGQFTMLYAFGIGEIPISISGSSSRRDRLTHTVRAVGAVSRALCETPVGGMMGVRGPFGSAWPHRARPGSDLVIVAGGIGLAPLRPVIYDAIEHRDDYRNVSVLIGARSEADLLFEDEFEAWRAGGVEVLVTLDAASDRWTGHVGVVTRLVPMATFRPRQCVAMVCGPEIMMRFATLTLLDDGVSSRDIHLTMERNMKCAIGTCGHCQYGPDFMCKEGPVFPLSHVSDRMFYSEI